MPPSTRLLRKMILMRAKGGIRYQILITPLVREGRWAPTVSYRLLSRGQFYCETNPYCNLSGNTESSLSLTRVRCRIMVCDWRQAHLPLPCIRKGPLQAFTVVKNVLIISLAFPAESFNTPQSLLIDAVSIPIMREPSRL